LKNLFFITFILLSLNLQAQFTSESSQSTSKTLNGKRIMITVTNGNTNGQKWKKCHVNNIEVNCELLECWNKNDNKKCDEIEKLLKTEQKINNKNIDDDIYIKTYTNKKNIFKGEQIEITYKLFYRLNLVSVEGNKIPDFNGFWKEEVQVKNETNEKIINNKKYLTQTIYKVLLTAQKSGEIIIEPLEYNFIYRQKDLKSKKHPFSNPFFDNYKDVPINIKSKEIAINVLPLPQTDIKSFNGIVGDFEIKSEIDKLTTESNNPIKYSITIKGLGNFELIDIPEIRISNDFDIYEPKINFKSFKTKNGTRGEKTFEFIILPRYPGNYSIPEYEFTFFNPKKKEYITETTSEFKLQINKNHNDEHSIQVSQKKETEAIDDIKHTYNDFKLKNNNILNYNITLILLLIIAPIVIIITLITMRYLKINLTKRTNNNENTAIKKIKQLEKEITKNKMSNSEFYDIMDNILWNYLSKKCGIPISDISKEKIIKQLKHINTNNETINNINEIIKMFEVLRFSQLKEEKEELKNLLKRLKNIIKNIK